MLKLQLHIVDDGKRNNEITVVIAVHSRATEERLLLYYCDIRGCSSGVQILRPSDLRSQIVDKIPGRKSCHERTTTWNQYVWDLLFSKKKDNTIRIKRSDQFPGLVTRWYWNECPITVPHHSKPAADFRHTNSNKQCRAIRLCASAMLGRLRTRRQGLNQRALLCLFSLALLFRTTVRRQERGTANLSIQPIINRQNHKSTH